MGKVKDEVVTIKADKVYTSYYARACKIIPDNRLVAISIGIPDGFNGEILRCLNTSSELLYKYKHQQINIDEYIETYKAETLSHLDPLEIYNKVKGKVLLCYCGKNSFCHRHIVLEWLCQSLGEEVRGNEL